MKSASTEWIPVGRIGRPKGLRGEVRVHVYNPASRLLEEIQSVATGKSPSDLIRRSFRKVAREPKVCVVSFEDVITREAAESLTGQEIFVRRGDFPALHAGEYYCCDLLGFTVVSESGGKIGTLTNVLSTASNDIYAIAGAEGETLLPAIPDVVRRIDLEKRLIVVRPPEVVDAL